MMTGQERIDRMIFRQGKEKCELLSLIYKKILFILQNPVILSGVFLSCVSYLSCKSFVALLKA